MRSLSSLSVSPNVRSPVLRFGMEQDGGQQNWDALWTRYQESVLSSEKTRVLYGMARTRHVWLLARYFMTNQKLLSQVESCHREGIADRDRANIGFVSWKRDVFTRERPLSEKGIFTVFGPILLWVDGPGHKSRHGEKERQGSFMSLSY